MAGIKSNPNQWVTNWQAGVGRSGQKYTQGIANSGDWAGQFTAAESRMIAGLQQAMADGRITRGVQRLGTNGWRTITQAKSGNWLTGVNNAQAKALAGANVLFQFLGNAENAMSNLPRGDFNSNVARMTAWVTSIHNDSVAYKATH